MNLLSPTLRQLNWYQLLLLIGLTTIAAVVILPYFVGSPGCGPAAISAAPPVPGMPPAMTHDAAVECPGLFARFYVLWFRLFIVAVVMLLSFLISEATWRARINRSFSLLTIQLMAVALGAFVGTVVSGLLIGRTLHQMFTVEPMLVGIIIFTAVGIGIGTLTAIVLVYRSRAARADANTAQAEAMRHALEKQVLEARLKLMQAQIEPHFLFNTLANVQHLTEVNPPLATKTLESLITYLRAALPQMREDSTKLGREVAMAVAFLDIQSVRMGARLQFSVDIPDALARESFPPMMLLTLVENAIKHGLDPLPRGGVIQIEAKRVGNTLEVRVSDNGCGLTMAAGIGVGLTNIRERLATLYGKRAHLQLAENTPTGVVATISISQA